VLSLIKCCLVLPPPSGALKIRGLCLQSSKYIMFSGSQVDTCEWIDGCDKANWCVFRRTHTVSVYYHCHIHPSVCPAVCVYQHGSHWGDLREIFWWGVSMKICIQIPNLVKMGTLPEERSMFYCGRCHKIVINVMSSIEIVSGC